MTRLHIQVNQTMQFYRGQQGGSAPQRLFLSGGASVMHYTPQFFAEKLNVPVEYFNPLRNIQIDLSINLEELQGVAHSLGEVVGLGLRNLAHCPVELNLMPESTLKWQAFNQKKPFFITTVFSLVAGTAAMGFLFHRLADVKNTQFEKSHPGVETEQRKSEQFKRAYGELQRTQQQVDQVANWMDDRFYWADVFSELRQVLIRVEEVTKAKLRTDTGVWIEQLTTMGARPEGEVGGMPPPPGDQPAAPQSAEAAAQADAFRRRYGLEPGGAPTPPPAPPPAEAAPNPEAAAPGARRGARHAKGGGTNEISTVNLTFRAVSWASVSADANKETAYAVLGELRNSPLFDPDPEETKFDGQISPDETPGTFSFKIIARLKRPLRVQM